MSTRERLKVYASSYAASYCGDDAWDKNDDRFRFFVDGFCVSVFPHDDGEHWAWSITESGFENGGSIAPIATSNIAMIKAWSAFTEHVRIADTGEQPKLTQEREPEAILLLTDAFAALALAGAKERAVNKFLAESRLGRNATLGGGIERVGRRVKEDPEIRRKSFPDYPVPPGEFRPLTLQEEVNLMVEVLWSDDQFRGWLEDENFTAAGEFLRREDWASDAILTATRVDVADSVQRAVKWLLRRRRA